MDLQQTLNQNTNAEEDRTKDRLYAASIMNSLATLVPLDARQIPRSPQLQNKSPELNQRPKQMASIPKQYQEIRTNRYITVMIDGLDLVGKKRLYLSFYEDGNGIPDVCYLLVPIRSKEIILSMKNSQGKGWVEVDTAKAKYPDFRVEFQVRISTTEDKDVDNSVIAFHFKDKMNNDVKIMGQCSIPVSLRCTKNKSDSITGRMTELLQTHNPLPNEITNTTPPQSTNHFQISQFQLTTLPLHMSQQLQGSPGLSGPPTMLNQIV